MGDQAATITFSINNARQEYRWPDRSASFATLGAVSVFDSKCANVHVDQANSIAYSPYPLQLLEKLAACVKKINERIDSEIRVLQCQTPDIIKNPLVEPKTSVGLALAEIDKLTKEHLAEISSFTQEDAAKLNNLEEDLKVEPDTLIDKLKSKISKLCEYDKKFKLIEQLVSAKNIQEISDCNELLQQKKTASVIVAQTLNDVSKLPDVGTDVWKHLWESARKYSEQSAYPDIGFPVTNNEALCVLCQQPLDVKAKTRFAKFDEFVKSKLEEEINVLSKKINDNKKRIEVLYNEFPNIRDISIFFSYDLGDLSSARNITKYLIQSKWNLRKILRGFNSVNNVDIVFCSYQDNYLLGTIKASNERLVSLANPNNNEQIEQTKREHAELTSKKWLIEHYNDVILEIDRKLKIKKLKHRRFNTKSITDKSKEISNELVSNALRGDFIQEINKLDLAGIAVEVSQAKSEQGVPYFQITFIHKPDKRIANVLSEGEHRCVALAIFLAELNCSGNNSTIIFDDPVSSLDHNHRENIAKRLVEESKKRQLIIFTHDISFLFTLIDNYKHAYGNEPTVRGLTRNNEDTGFCNNEPPLKVQTVSKRIDSFKSHFKNVTSHYEQGRAAEWEREAKSLTRDLREIWELAVEDILSPAIKRFSNKLETRGIFRISVLTEEHCKEMRGAYKRCSELCHLDSPARNLKMLKPDCITKEIEMLEYWYSTLKRRQDEVNEY